MVNCEKEVEEIPNIINQNGDINHKIMFKKFVENTVQVFQQYLKIIILISHYPSDAKKLYSADGSHQPMLKAIGNAIELIPSAGPFLKDAVLETIRYLELKKQHEQAMKVEKKLEKFIYAYETNRNYTMKMISRTAGRIFINYNIQFLHCLPKILKEGNLTTYTFSKCLLKFALDTVTRIFNGLLDQQINSFNVTEDTLIICFKKGMSFAGLFNYKSGGTFGNCTTEDLFEKPSIFVKDDRNEGNIYFSKSLKEKYSETDRNKSISKYLYRYSFHFEDVQEEPKLEKKLFIQKTGNFIDMFDDLTSEMDVLIDEVLERLQTNESKLLEKSDKLLKKMDQNLETNEDTNKVVNAMYQMLMDHCGKSQHELVRQLEMKDSVIGELQNIIKDLELKLLETEKVSYEEFKQKRSKIMGNWEIICHKLKEQKKRTDQYNGLTDECQNLTSELKNEEEVKKRKNEYEKRISEWGAMVELMMKTTISSSKPRQIMIGDVSGSKKFQLVNVDEKECGIILKRKKVKRNYKNINLNILHRYSTNNM